MLAKKKGKFSEALAYGDDDVGSQPRDQDMIDAGVVIGFGTIHTVCPVSKHSNFLPPLCNSFT